MGVCATSYITYVARPLHPREADLLLGSEDQWLRFVSEEGVVVKSYTAPASGWTHDTLEQHTATGTMAACDAFVGSAWVGSTEI